MNKIVQFKKQKLAVIKILWVNIFEICTPLGTYIFLCVPEGKKIIFFFRVAEENNFEVTVVFFFNEQLQDIEAQLNVK